MLHRLLIILLSLLTVAVLAYGIATGWDYYGSTPSERAHHPLHPLWKAGGVVGHGFGVAGSALLLLLLLYLPRKNFRALQGLGKLSHWLNIHIWMGITGPLLITLHSTFKFGGIVAISYWSMVAVALSGVLGRYIYLQIPRTLSGQELSEAELQGMDEKLLDDLLQSRGVDRALTDEIARMLEPTSHGRGLGAVLSWIGEDLARPMKLVAVRRKLQQATDLSASKARELAKLAKKRATLQRRRAFLSVARKLLHHWHVVHRPFALVMYIIMFVHVGVALLFGYHWVF